MGQVEVALRQSQIHSPRFVHRITGGYDRPFFFFQPIGRRFKFIALKRIQNFLFCGV